MTSKEKATLRDILDRLKEIEHIKNDVDLATPLNTNKRNISAWKERDSIPWGKLIDYCHSKHISLEWLINGIGPITVSKIMVAEPGALYRVETDQDGVYSLASNVYKALLKLGREISPKKFEEIVRLLHRDMLDSGATDISFEKVMDVVKLAI